KSSRHRGALEHRPLLRLVLLRRSARQLPRHRVGRQDRARRRRDGPRPDRGGAPRLAVLSRPPARVVRGDGGAAAMSLLVKGGTIVTATDHYAGDVLVEGEKITTIGTSL